MNFNSTESDPSKDASKVFLFMSETQIAYLMLFTAPGMFVINMLVARMADEAPPFVLAFWRWLGVLMLMLMLRVRQLWSHRQNIQ